MAIEYVSKDTAKKVQEVDKARLALLEKLNKSTAQNVKVVEGITKALVKNEEVATKYANAHAKELGVAFEYARAIQGATIKVKSFRDELNEAIKKIPLIGDTLSQANEDPTSFNFSQEVPLIGLKARLLKNVAAEVEKAVTFFTDDLSTAFSATVDSFTERFQRELFGDIKVYTDKLKGRQNVRDEIISSLGPLAQYANPQLVDSLYSTKVRLFVDPSVDGANRIANQLNPKINDFSEKEAFNLLTLKNLSLFSSILSLSNIATAPAAVANLYRLGSKKEEKL